MKRSGLAWIVAIAITLAVVGIVTAVFFGLLGGFTRDVAIPQSDVQITAIPVALGFRSPVGAVWRTERYLYVFEKSGLIHRIDSSEPSQSRQKPIVVLDLRATVAIEDRQNARRGEQGLMGVAFDPFNASHVYVSYSAPAESSERSAGSAYISRLSRFSIEQVGSDAERFVQEKVILDIPQATRVHHAQTLEFDKSSGLLYYSTGDSGPQFDPFGVAQDVRDLRGKLLRIDVGRSEPPRAYAIPPTNPFASDPSKGAPEIVALGLRNPWRFSLDDGDSDSGPKRIFIGDVGFNDFESIDMLTVGEWSDGKPVNFGWNTYEGSKKTLFGRRRLADGTVHRKPIFEYETGSNIGRAVVGGYSIAPKQYLFADFVTANIVIIEERAVKTAAAAAAGDQSEWALHTLRTPAEWLPRQEQQQKKPASDDERVNIPALARDLGGSLYAAVWLPQTERSGLYRLKID